MAGTISGELSALAGMPRNATVIAEKDSILWKLSTQDLDKMHDDDSALAKQFTQLILKGASLTHDIAERCVLTDFSGESGV